MTDSAAELPTWVRVPLGERSYDIAIGERLLPTLPQRLGEWRQSRFGSPAAGPVIVVTDTNVADLARPAVEALTEAGWRADLITLPPGEAAKTLDAVNTIYDRMIAGRCDRSSPVIAIGGGVIGDTAGFAAATYARGVPFVQVPTTLLAMVDSSVGGKVGVNHPQAKNMIGAFHQPLGVLIDLTMLASLPDRDYRSGLAEVVKYGVILDSKFFERLEGMTAELNARQSAALAAVIQRSCELKAFVVERDEYERTGLRAVLNYGHTFAHAFEALAGYGRLTHGEAVAIGMVCASRLAEALGRIPADVTARQVRLLESLGLPTRLPDDCEIPADAAIERMQLDKKTVAGELRFVLPTRLGEVEVVKGVDAEEVRTALTAAGCR